MNGTILMELDKYVKTKHGPEAWKKVSKEAGIGFRLYMPVADYPDEELVALVKAASDLTKTPVPALLEDFGEFIVPDLIKLFGHLIDPKWKTLDLIANTELTIHEALRRASANVKPPVLKCERPSPREVVVHYASHRRMCEVAKGIIRGVAKHYAEPITITERSCMHKGAASCDLVVTLA